MKHGATYLAIDNTAVQEAVASNQPSEVISYLKQQVAWDAVYGFEYDEVSFEQLGNLLNNDYGFTPFKYKSVGSGAIFNTDKHPNAWGRVRGRANVNNSISWLCLDVDKSEITAEEMHQILSSFNHHIARTSDKDNAYKMRVLIELDNLTEISEEMWKPFVRSVGLFIGIPDIDMLGRSQVFYGYKGRKVLSQLGGLPIETSRHLQVARMKVAELEEKRATELPVEMRDAALQSPFNTFGFAYEAANGEGTTKLMAAIHLAKEMGASKEYITDMVHSINNFWDYPMSASRLQSTVLTALY